MDGTSFDRGGVGEAREWLQPWRSGAPMRAPQPARGRRLTRAQLRLVQTVRLPLYDLAKSVARGCMSSDVDDLHQIAMEHALRLVTEYRLERGATFLTFVFWRVRVAMKGSLRAEKRDRAYAAAAERGTRVVQDACELGAVLNESPRERRERKRTEGYELAVAAILGCYSEPESPEERAMMEQERTLSSRAIEHALLRLDKTANALVRAHFWEDMSVAAAARRLGLEYEDARYRLKSALGLIGKMLRAGRSSAVR